MLAVSVCHRPDSAAGNVKLSEGKCTGRTTHSNKHSEHYLPMVVASVMLLLPCSVTFPIAIMFNGKWLTYIEFYAFNIEVQYRWSAVSFIL